MNDDPKTREHGPTPLLTRGRLDAILRQRCPRCREGRVFARRFSMNKTCPVCHLVFEREPGYFVAAMYISYAMAVPALGLFALLLRVIFPEWGLNADLVGAAVLTLPLVPALFRYSRILWLHIDRTLAPGP